MKKKTLMTLMLMFVIIPCMTVFAACGGDNNAGIEGGVYSAKQLVIAEQSINIEDLVFEDESAVTEFVDRLPKASLNKAVWEESLMNVLGDNKFEWKKGESIYWDQIVRSFSISRYGDQIRIEFLNINMTFNFQIKNGGWLYLTGHEMSDAYCNIRYKDGKFYAYHWLYDKDGNVLTELSVVYTCD